MKKLISLMLALAMVFSMAIAASAATNVDGDEVSSIATTINFTKEYTVNGGSTFPAETLNFTVTAAEGNPDTTTITVGDDNEVVITGVETQIEINVPAYSTVGEYTYTVKENKGTTQGVTYSEASFTVKVQVYWNEDHDALLTNAIIETKDDAGNKIDSIANVYDLGGLNVTKKVTGNLGDTTKEFKVDVTLTATGDVKSDITYVDGTETKTITAADMTDKTETVTITVKHGETVSFTNIPAGVTYTVEEHDYTDGDVNSENGYDDPKYDNGNGDYTIASGETETATITNNKGTTVATGIVTDSAPYIILIAVCAVAAVAFVVKRRNAAEF